MPNLTEEDVRKIIREEISTLFGRDKFVFEKNIQILNARNIQVGRGNGTKIGTAVDQKIGLYNTTPVVQASAISAPSGGGDAGVDTPARNAINSIRTALKNLGIIA